MERQTVKCIKIDFADGVDVVLIDKTFKPIEEGSDFNDEKRIHTHPYYEIFFCGDCPLKIIDEYGESFYRRRIVVIPPFFSHYAVSGAGTFRFFLQPKNPDRGKGLFGCDPAEKKSVVCADVNEDDFFYLKKAYECFIKYPSDATKLKMLIELILFNTAEHFNERRVSDVPVSDCPSAEYAFEIEKAISGCVNERITLSDVAAALYLSEKQTSRIIIKNYGKPLSAVISDRRLTAAALLLKNTDKSVSQIAFETGFNTECSFFDLFKRKYGLTPLSYRKQFLHE